MAGKLKLLTNLPLVGQVTGAFFAPSQQYEDEIKLTLTVAAECAPHYAPGRQTVYLKLWAADKLAELGVLTIDADPKDQSPRYTLVGRPVVEILRTEEGGQKRTAIKLLGGPKEASAPAAAPAPARAAATEAPRARAPELTEEERKAQRARVSAELAREWYLLGEAVQAAAFLAARALSKATGKAAAELDPMAVHALASTLMITMEKRGFGGAPGLVGKLEAAVGATAPLKKPAPKAEPVGTGAKPGTGWDDPIGGDASGGAGAEDDDDLPF